MENEVGITGGKAAQARSHLERRLIEPANVDIRGVPETCGDCRIFTYVGITGAESMHYGQKVGWNSLHFEVVK